MGGTESPASTMSSIISGPGKLKDKPKQLQQAYEKWVSIQPPWVEGISSGFFGAFQGAFLGTLMGTMARGSLEQAGGAGASGNIFFNQV